LKKQMSLVLLEQEFRISENEFNDQCLDLPKQKKMKKQFLAF